MIEVIIRNEAERDFREVEVLTRKAFWNVNVPGCEEYYLAHILREHSFEKAAQLGYRAIVIFGNPGNYVSRGFKSCKRHQICLADGSCPTAMLVKELGFCPS